DYLHLTFNLTCFKTAVTVCVQLLVLPPTATLPCSSTVWPHSISVRRSCSSFLGNDSRAPPASRNERHHYRSHPRPLDDSALLGALGQTLPGQRLLRRRPKLARHGRRHRTTAPRSRQLRVAWTERSCRSLRANHSRARNSANHHRLWVRRPRNANSSRSRMGRGGGSNRF